VKIEQNKEKENLQKNTTKKSPKRLQKKSSSLNENICKKYSNCNSYDIIFNMIII
jgi:hypothetical protein